MKENAKTIITTLVLGALFFLPFHISNSSDFGDSSQTRDFKTLEYLLEKRKNYFTPSSGVVSDRIINILIVPGHDNEYSGAEFAGIKEVEFNRIVAQKLYEYLSKEPGMNIFVAHQQEEYSYFLKNVFETRQKEIEDFIEDSIKSFSGKKKNDNIELEDSGFHNTARPEVRYRLYGINWWANKAKIDLVIHIHFNDHPGRKWDKEGDYDGFSIYIPGEHFQNHKLSKVLGESIFEELVKIRPISNLPYEEKGLIEGHELIAVGSNESVEAGAVLIEYGYIYEDLFQDKTKRDITFDYLAYTTYKGIKKMFNENAFEKEKVKPATVRDKTTRDNLVWQFEKALQGLYPPNNKTLRDCPITGFFGECSREVK